jgi:hypothetical protein
MMTEIDAYNPHPANSFRKAAVNMRPNFSSVVENERIFQRGAGAWSLICNKKNQLFALRDTAM